MQINTSKTKEMFLGRLNPVNVSVYQLVQSNESPHSNSFELISIFEANLSWSFHFPLPDRINNLQLLLKPVNVFTFKSAQDSGCSHWPTLAFLRHKGGISYSDRRYPDKHYPDIPSPVCFNVDADQRAAQHSVIAPFR